MRRTLIAWIIIAFIIACYGPPSQRSSSRTPTPQVFALLRLVVTDSVNGGGTREGQHYSAADSLSGRLLSSAGVAIDSSPLARGFMCPGSTTISGTSVPPPVGYTVRVSIHATSDSAGWLLGVNESCGWMNHGRGPSGFEEGRSWEIRKVAGKWRIVRALGVHTT
jgi:hypothetical protein